MRSDGGVKVINRGYSVENKDWKEAEGKASFVENKNSGYLKVSFFGPFYGSYIVFELDHEDYKFSLVSGPDKSYLWILARSSRINENIQSILIKKAVAMGVDTNKLIYVKNE